MKVVVGTRNAHKIEELLQILSPLLPGVELVPSQGEAPEENGSTFYENALIKARAAQEESGLPAIADDSGIEVAALDGAPGIHSARYSPSGVDVENTALVLSRLEGQDNRAAEFVCAAAYVTALGEYVIERRWAGSIAQEPSGAGGFGYDPIFIPHGHSVSAAQLSAEQKNELSHRGQAFQALALLMRELPQS
jgi:XTP/dITP diphosphohydrolase